jgi:hypothetical protein
VAGRKAQFWISARPTWKQAATIRQQFEADLKEVEAAGPPNFDDNQVLAPLAASRRRREMANEKAAAEAGGNLAEGAHVAYLWPN